MATTASESPPVVVVRRAIPSRLWLALAFFAIYVVWGTTYLAIRYAVETIPPLVTAGVRHTAAGLLAPPWGSKESIGKMDWVS